MYKFFDVTFWKFTLYIEQETARYFLLPSLSLEIKLTSHAPIFTSNLMFWQYLIIFTYCETNVPEYQIIENDFVD